MAMYTVTHRLYGSLALVLLSAVITASCANLPLSEWEQMLSAESGARPFSSLSTASTALDPSHSRGPLSQPVNTDGSWSDILLHQEQLSPQATSVDLYEDPAYTDLERGLQTLQERLQAEHAIWSRNGLREFSTEDRRQTLTRVKRKFYEVVGSRSMRQPPIIQPYYGQASREEFQGYINELLELRETLGMWPYLVDGRRFLLHQVNPISLSFERVNGLVHRDGNRLLFGVWQETGTQDPEIYQYIGVFQTPDHRRTRRYRDQTLMPTARHFASIRMLSTSTIMASFVMPP